MQSRKIGVLLGGLSSERDVSLRTGEAVLAALRERGHDAVPIYVDRDVDVALRQEQIEVAFIALHGRWGEDGCIQGMLEMMGIPYTGSDVMASALAMHKGKAKELFRLHNLPTPAYYVLDAAALAGVPVPVSTASPDELIAIHVDRHGVVAALAQRSEHRLAGPEGHIALAGQTSEQHTDLAGLHLKLLAASRAGSGDENAPDSRRHSDATSAGTMGQFFGPRTAVHRREIR